MRQAPSNPGDAPTIPDLTQSPAPSQYVAQGPRPFAPSSGATPTNAAPRAPQRRKVTGIERAGNKLAQVIGLCADVIFAVLVLRIVLIFLGADPRALFAGIIALLSEPLVTPFNALFPPILVLQGQVDLAAVVAILTYALAARILVSLVRLVTRW